MSTMFTSFFVNNIDKLVNWVYNENVIKLGGKYDN